MGQVLSAGGRGGAGGESNNNEEKGEGMYPDKKTIMEAARIICDADICMYPSHSSHPLFLSASHPINVTCGTTHSTHIDLTAQHAAQHATQHATQHSRSTHAACTLITTASLPLSLITLLPFSNIPNTTMCTHLSFFLSFIHSFIHSFHSLIHAFIHLANDYFSVLFATGAGMSADSGMSSPSPSPILSLNTLPSSSQCSLAYFMLSFFLFKQDFQW